MIKLNILKISTVIIITIIVLGLVSPKLISEDSDILVITGIALLLLVGYLDYLLIKSTSWIKNLRRNEDEKVSN